MVDSESKPLLKDTIGKVQNSEPADTNNKTADKWRFFSIEPVAMLYFLYLTPAILVGEQYIFKIISAKYNYTVSDANASVCNSDSTSTILQLQQKVQRESSLIMLMLDITSVVPSLVSTLIIGSYSDTKGRKIALLLPPMGAILKCSISAVVIRYNMHYGFLAIGTCLEGMTGLTPTLVTGCFAYLADVTTMESRSMKVTILAVLIGMSMSVSQFVSGYMINAVGYLYSNVFLIGINLLNMLYIFFILPKVQRKKSVILNVFHLLSKCVKLYIYDNGTNRRWKLQLNFLLLLVTGMVVLAGADATTYFLRGRPLCFGPDRVGLFAGGASLAVNFGSLVGAKLIGERIGDLWLMVVSCFSGIGGALILMFTQTVWMLALCKFYFLAVFQVTLSITFCFLHSLCPVFLRYFVPFMHFIANFSVTLSYLISTLYE